MNENEQKNIQTNAGAPAAQKAEQIRDYSPRVDIWETDQAVFLTADMPGVSEKDVDIDLQGNTLEFSGIARISAPAEYSAAHCEFPAAKRYVRQFTLGESLDHDAITAEMKDGVLTLTLPKSKNVQPRKITVQRG